jgi:hypothetical protein
MKTYKLIVEKWIEITVNEKEIEVLHEQLKELSGWILEPIN